jgi:hypothetical protein
VHGFRYLAFFSIVIFASGLFARTGLLRSNHSIGWGVVGLLGTSIFVTNGVVTNGIEMLAFLNVDYISERQEFSYLLFRLTRVLFTAEIVTWSIMIFGFSIAGLLSRTLPKWLAAMGLVNTVAGLLTGCFIVSVMKGGRALVIADIAAFTGLFWFLATDIYMLVRGAVASEFNH